MDEAQARQVAAELIGRCVGGWHALEFIGSGRSAVVLRAQQGDRCAALKVFDPELVLRVGGAVQRARVQRELCLRGHSHPHLVQILDGGRCDATGYFFLVMEFLDWPDLAAVLDEVPEPRIGPIIAQVASAARFLETLGQVHRDIKPSNIAVAATPAFARTKLLDLALLRPVGESHLTDAFDNRPFLGPMRYSPPEFLGRAEEHTTEGWRAVTFYQLGAVLHDLITRRPLFKEYSHSYLRLAEAVRSVTPTIENPRVSASLTQLALDCLAKEPAQRLARVTWERFEMIA